MMQRNNSQKQEGKLKMTKNKNKPLQRKKFRAQAFQQVQFQRNSKQHQQLKTFLKW